MDFIQKADDQGSESLETIQELTSAVAVAIFVQKSWASGVLLKARKCRGQVFFWGLQRMQDVNLITVYQTIFFCRASCCFVHFEKSFENNSKNHHPVTQGCGCRCCCCWDWGSPGIYPSRKAFPFFVHSLWEGKTNTTLKDSYQIIKISPKIFEELWDNSGKKVSNIPLLFCLESRIEIVCSVPQKTKL